MDAPVGARALGRFRVVELGSTISAPFCGRLLADFGAEVIKVEDVAGDTLRTLGEQVEGKSLYAASLFRNKAVVAVDLRAEEGRAVVRDLAGAADVLVENFRPGLLERWGLGWDVLRAINPRLVIVRISGFGQTGPYAHRPGYGVIGEAVSGLRHINGDPDRPPGRMATALTDYVTGLSAAFGALVALLHREATGVGQCVDAALSECAFAFMEPYVQYYDRLGIVAERAGSRLPGATPNNLYPTGDGRFVLIAAFADPIFRRLCRAMGREALADDPAFATLSARNARVEAVDAAVAAWTATLPLDAIERALEAAEVPATRIFTMADIFADPHYRARDMLVPVPDDDVGPIRMAAPVPRLSGTPGAVRHAGRRLGADTVRVLREVAGYDDDRIARLAAAGAIRVADAGEVAPAGGVEEGTR